MNRVAVAIFLAPIFASLFLERLFASLFFWRYFILAYVAILLFAVVVALPVFFILEKKKRLSFRYAIVTGLLIGLIVPVFSLDTYGFDYLISMSSLLFVGVGMSTANLFWWIAVFRNPEYPFVSTRVPYGQLIIVPVYIFGFLFYGHLGEIRGFHSGQVLSVQDESPYPFPSKKCTATVLLDNGNEVQSDFTGCGWPIDMVLNTSCFHLHKRWSTLRFKSVYSISNQCGHPPPVYNDPTVKHKLTPQEFAMRHPRQAAEKALSERNSPILREAVNYWSFEDPAATLDWLESNIDDNNSGNLRSLVLHTWMRHDPDSAFSRAELFLNSVSGKQYRMPLAFAYFEHRAKSDPDGANDWALENGFPWFVND